MEHKNSAENAAIIGGMFVVIAAFIALIPWMVGQAQNAQATETSVAATQAALALTLSVTPTPSITPSNTSTPTRTPTSTPRPTRTPTPTFVPLLTPVALANVQVSFSDDFRNGNSFTSQWGWSNRSIATFEDGRLIFDAQTDWRDWATREWIIENEGILLLFQYESGFVDFNLASGNYQTSDYRRWGLIHDNSYSWRSYHLINDWNQATETTTVTLERGQWYYLLLRVGEGGVIQTYLWHRDDPSHYIINERELASGATWANRSWKFTLTGSYARFYVDLYEELTFPSGYMLPDTPPS
jgi:hypothetical protein